jgi:hypothetical protein
LPRRAAIKHLRVPALEEHFGFLHRLAFAGQQLLHAEDHAPHPHKNQLKELHGGALSLDQIPMLASRLAMRLTTPTTADGSSRTPRPTIAARQSNAGAPGDSCSRASLRGRKPRQRMRCFRPVPMRLGQLGDFGFKLSEQLQQFRAVLVIERGGILNSTLNF